MHPTYVVAHRGDARQFRENTLDAYRAAAEHGAAAVELDARLTADGQLVVHHDPVVAGVAGSGEPTAIARARRQDLPEWMPSLAEALAACAPMDVIVEVKDLPHEPGFSAEHTTMLAAADLVAELMDQGRTGLSISSFFHPALMACGERYPQISRACLTSAEWDQERMLRGAVRMGARSFHPNEAALTPELVTEAHRHGLMVEPWTVNDPARVAQLIEWGVDRIMTDDIDMALGVGAAARDAIGAGAHNGSGDGATDRRLRPVRA